MMFKKLIQQTTVASVALLIGLTPLSLMAQTLDQQLTQQKLMNEELLRQLQDTERQLEVLQNQSSTSLSTQEPRVIVKEVIREVPIASPQTPMNDARIQMELSELKTEAAAYKAERDEYKRLLQDKHQQLLKLQDIAAQVDMASGTETNLVADVRRLESEKADLIRQLEFAKANMSPEELDNTNKSISANNLQISQLRDQLLTLRDHLQETEQEKQSLELALQQTNNTLAESQSRLETEQLIATLADDSAESIQKQLEQRTIESEQAALEAQAATKQADLDTQNTIAASRQKLRARITSQPIELSGDIRPTAPAGAVAPTNITWNETAQTPAVPVAPVVATSAPTSYAQALSGDDIRQLVASAAIPLSSSIDRIDRVSGPDFAAFQWDTGMVYGSAEQSRMANPSALRQSANDYIMKTQSRCGATFDQNVTPMSVNGVQAITADIACVDASGQGSAAAILFFEQNGMFYALAHEGDALQLSIAMDMRDRLTSHLGDL